MTTSRQRSGPQPADGPALALARLHRPLPVAQRIYEEIRRDLFQGNLPGGRLVELDLAHRYRVSRTPVRQALQRLTAAGFTEALPNGGYILKRLSSREVREMLDLRVLLEPVGARLAAEQADAPRVAVLIDLAGRSEIALRTGGPAMSELNYEFHSAIGDASANRPLARILRVLNERLMAHEAFGPRGPGASSSLGGEHLDIARSIAARDGKAAERATREHLANSHGRILAWLRQAGVGR